MKGNKDKNYVKKRLQEKLDHNPRDNIWGELKNSQEVNDVINYGMNRMNVLVNRYNELNNRFPLTPKKERKTYMEEPSDERLIYLSKILAWDASHEKIVIDFRQEVLNNTLLSPEQIENCLNNLADQDKGNEICYIKVRLPQDTKLADTDTGILLQPPLIIDKLGIGTGASLPGREFLSYGVFTENKWVTHAMLVTGGGNLERLLNLSKHLSSIYNWSEAGATVFILTGLPQPIPLARTKYIVRKYAPNTITMELNTHLHPSQVGKFYSKAKKEFNPAHGRDRLITKKHLELAVFYHTHQGMKGADMMSLWNKEHKEYEYTILTNFQRDAKYAHDRLVNMQ